eukprot:171139-Pyramimonas_sp.AAC.1
MAGRSALTMSTVCAASGRFAYPGCRLEVTSREGLSTRRNRCLSSGLWGSGASSRSSFSKSSTGASASLACASSLSPPKGSSSRHGSPSTS